MESFDFRTACNQLLAVLNEKDHHPDAFKIGFDIRLQEQFRGNPSLLISEIQRVALLVHGALGGGTVDIEITSRARTHNIVIIQVSISGRRTNAHDRPINFLHDLKNEVTHDLNLKVDSRTVIIDFKYALDIIEQSKSEAKPPFFRKRVLLAEDNEINAMVFTSFLEEWGCENITAHNGEEAVSIAHKGHFDAIIMDIFMPGLNGHQATRKIREFDTNIPIIALTGSTREEDIREAVAAGANDYILKPVSVSNLFNVLSKYFQTY